MNFENIKVLVIDDNQSMQTLFKAIIKKYFQSDIESLLSSEDAKKHLHNNSY